jgi:hypothetical protein
VLSRLFRRLFLEKLVAAHQANELQFFNDLAPLAKPQAFAALLAPLRKIEWVVYAKKPFAGPPYGEPGAVLAYLSRYTHRVAIANSRLIAFDGQSVTFRWKDYRAKAPDRQKVMTLEAGAFIRRFLLHVLPRRFHRIRHTGFFANGNRAANLALARKHLNAPIAPEEAEIQDQDDDGGEDRTSAQPCPSCGGTMIVIETFAPGQQPQSARARDPPPSRTQ